MAAGGDAKPQQTTQGVSGKAGGLKGALGFTKSNELFLGRLAMLGFASSLMGEALTGKGALAQLGLETGVPVFELDWAILALVGFNLVAALLPSRGRFVADEAPPADRPASALRDPATGEIDWRRIFGVKRFGFTKENEIFVGRCAQLGFAASLLGEAVSGKGIMGQFDAETGLPWAANPVLLAAAVAFTFVATIVASQSGKFVDE